jgi:hypothetical protein
LCGEIGAVSRASRVARDTQPSIYLSVYLSIYPSIYQSIHPFYLSIDFPIDLYRCMAALAMAKPIAQPSGWKIAARPHSPAYL